MKKFVSVKNKLYGFSLPELLVVLVIIGILVLVALPNLMPLISRAKATEAQQHLTFLHSLEQSYFYTYSRYSDDLMELGFEQAQLVTEGGNANYRIEVISADEKGFKAQAVSVVDFDKDGIFNVWEIDQEKKTAREREGLMVRWLSMLLVIPLVLVMISDVRSRSVSSWWLLTFGILNAIFLGLLDGWKCVMLRIVGNLLLLLLMGAALWEYSKVRHKRLPELLGMGDVLFLTALSPAFEWSDYMKFIVVSSLAGILLWPLFREHQPLKIGVPMVSIMAFVYLVSIGCRLFMV